VQSRFDRLSEAADLTWESIHDSPPDKRGPLLAQYRAILADLETLEPQKAVDPIDEIAQRRADRTASAAKRSVRAKRQG
jgi:hypothetical protein